MPNESTTATERVELLPSERVLIVRTPNDAVVLIDERGQRTSTVTLRLSQAVKVHKLLTLPEDPIPSYTSDGVWALAEEVPSRHGPPSDRGTSAGPLLETTDADGVMFSSATGETVTMTADELETFRAVLASWQFTMTSDDRPGILTFPAMIRLEGEGVTEPMVHVEFDEILEQYHRSVGYWSPARSEYVVEHS